MSVLLPSRWKFDENGNKRTLGIGSDTVQGRSAPHGGSEGVRHHEDDVAEAQVGEAIEAASAKTV
jgi:hypothetical protein